MQKENLVFIPQANCIENQKIYFDREGNLYPPSEIHSIDKDKFWNPNKHWGITGDTTSKLKVYFEHQPEILEKVCNQLGIEEDFDELQSYMLQAYTKQINAEVAKGNKIVFLIHGFNSNPKESVESFEALKTELNKKDNLSVVEMYWDGLFNDKGPGIWGAAQANSAFVGLGVRKFLNLISSNAEIILLTHSLGASVATQSLFNVSKWSSEFQKEVDEKAKAIPTPPQKDITLAMIAPAIPGQNTFDDLGKTTYDDTCHIKKIIVGYNKKDFALTKCVGIKKHFGSTSLGCNADNEVEKVKKKLAENFKEIHFHSFDLNEGLEDPKNHSVIGYIEATNFQSFLDETIN